MILGKVKKYVKEWIKSVVREMFREEMLTGGKGTWYIDNDKIGIKASGPKFFLIDTVSGMEMDIVNSNEELSVIAPVLSVSGNLNVLESVSVVNDLNVGDDVSISGNANVNGSIAVGGSLSWKGGVLCKLSAKATAGAGVYGSSVDIVPNSGYVGIVPIVVEIVVAGAGTSETITTEITVTYSDGTTASLTKDITGNGTILLGLSDIGSLIKNGVYIEKITVASKSSATSTAATSTVTVSGIEH